ncbi:MAG: hypothetical protein U0572_05260 [Phycisphaerales bacterium]
MTSAMSALIAYIPFIEPMPAAHRWWWLLIVPLALGISMSWKAVRATTMDGYWRQVGVMSGQIVLGVMGIALGLFVLIQLVLPHLPAE